MCAVDEVRATIRSLNKAAFTNHQLGELLPHLHKETISQTIIKLKKDGEVVVCGKVALPTGGRRNLMREGKIKVKYVRPVFKRKELDLAGWRKVLPSLFTDPKIPGSRRFVDNGLHQ